MSKFNSIEYWRGLLVSSPGELPDPWIEPRSPALQEDSLLSEPLGKFFHFPKFRIKEPPWPMRQLSLAALWASQT